MELLNSLDKITTVLCAIQIVGIIIFTIPLIKMTNLLIYIITNVISVILCLFSLYLTTMITYYNPVFIFYVVMFMSLSFLGFGSAIFHDMYKRNKETTN